MLTILISIITIIIAVSVGVLIKKGKINSYIVAYEKARGKEEAKLEGRISSYLGNSFYALSIIVMFFTLINYSGYSNSILLLIVALIIWFVTTVVGTQLIE